MSRTHVVLGILLLAGCGSAVAPPAPPPPEVGIVTLAAERAVLTTELPARTVPYLVAEVRPQVNGILLERSFTEGAEVREGDLLYRIDPAPYRAAVEEAEAALAMAEASLPAARSRAERLEPLAAMHAVGQQDLDDARAALRQAEAAVAASRATLETARIRLSYTPIRAPISGRIGRSNVTVGALVTAYQPVPLAVIQRLDPIYVDAMQSSSDLLRLRRGLATGELTREGESWRKVRLLLEEGTPYPDEGRLEFHDVTVEPTTGAVTLRMVFPNRDHVLLPGMFVRAVVEEGVRDDAILAPQQGVTRDPRGSATALVVGEGEKAEERRLVLDRAVGDRWLVLEGLAPGDRLIVDGLQRVRAGAPVRAVSATAEK